MIKEFTKDDLNKLKEMSAEFITFMKKARKYIHEADVEYIENAIEGGIYTIEHFINKENE